MPVRLQDARVAAHANTLGQRMGRLHNELTGEFLHMGGEKLTNDIDRSWLCYLYQAQNIRTAAAQNDLDLVDFYFYKRSHFMAD